MPKDQPPTLAFSMATSSRASMVGHSRVTPFMRLKEQSIMSKRMHEDQLIELVAMAIFARVYSPEKGKRPGDGQTFRRKLATTCAQMHAPRSPRIGA
jgi:hypothetical protein